ncbi:MAG: DNA polymerase III subunit epsilon [Alphaproteobacteria bacterium]|nr:DNA polymerase III subunit epsilon [Alphaproteobacteria bacterium]
MHDQTLRHIVLDTETTGLSPKTERIIEIACVELKNFVPTGNHYQAYINPEQPISPDAENIHGLSSHFLQDFPPFAHYAKEILDFIEDSPLVIHNAPFDIGFIEAEYKRLRHPLPNFKVIDTLQLARKKFPGAPASLDALCKRFNISLEQRSMHGALIDCQLLSGVYLELVGGSQRSLAFKQDVQQKNTVQHISRSFPKRNFPAPEEEIKQHNQLIASLKGAVWNKGHSES